MPAENEQPQVGDNGAGTPPPNEGQPPAGGRTEINSLPPDVQTYIEELRRENAKWRTEKKKAEDAARKAEETRLAEQQQWKELADKRGKDLEGLEAIRAKSEEIEAAFNASLEARLKLIPEDKRKRMVDPIRATMNPIEFAKWLDANEADLKTRPAPNLDAGAGGTTGSTALPDLTPYELEIAKASGMTAQEYAKYKRQGQQSKQIELPDKKGGGT